MLSTRIKTAAVLLPIALLLLWNGGVPAIALALLVHVLVCYEYYSFSTPFVGRRKAQFVALSGAVPLGYFFGGFAGLCAGIVLAALLAIILTVIVVENEVHLGPFQVYVPALLLGVVYPGAFSSLLVVAASIYPGKLLIWLLLTVAAADTAAYFGGRAFGQRLLAPRISPKKTVEGLIAGLLGCMLVGVGAAYWLLTPSGWVGPAAAALLVGVLAVFGDLAESLTKRIHEVKDSGNLLPGHGGVLDRVDALLFAAPGLFAVGSLLV